MMDLFSTGTWLCTVPVCTRLYLDLHWSAMGHFLFEGLNASGGLYAQAKMLISYKWGTWMDL